MRKERIRSYRLIGVAQAMLDEAKAEVEVKAAQEVSKMEKGEALL